MLNPTVIIICIALYMALLFAIAYFGDKRAEHGRSIISNPYVYSLSIAVYCTAWTFFGSVGWAAKTGLGFLPIYLGPTLMAALWWFVLRKIILISRKQRITSIADFIGSRYGKSALVTGLVTVIAVIGILPYISLQLKAISTSFLIIQQYPLLTLPVESQAGDFFHDTAFYIALLLAAFTILFGTRHIDVTERHEGMVAAIAFESLVKLFAFVVLGLYVTFGLFDGPADIFSQISADPDQAKLLTMEATPGGYASWFALMLISMSAILFLPRQFQVTVVENVNEQHLRHASWMFPLYLFAINLFVLPIALGGLLLFDGVAIDPDTFVLTIPMAQHAQWLALLVFIGGVSAATGMVIVATIALSTMVSNELLMPALLRRQLAKQPEGMLLESDLTDWVLRNRRGSIIVILLLAYLYFRLIGESYALVTIGLVSFVAAAQFAPAILIGIYWKGATRQGALAGLSAGFVIWLYTLLLPAFAKSGWLPISFVEQGLFGWSLLKPYALLGLTDLDHITHSVFWSIPVNVFLLIAVSLRSSPSALEQLQASEFVDVFKDKPQTLERVDVWRGGVTVSALKVLVGRFIGEQTCNNVFAQFAQERGLEFDDQTIVQPHTHLVSHGERLIAGVIGGASARIMISTLYKGQTINIGDVMKMLDETSQAMEYSQKLEKKTRLYEATSKELRAANKRLQELDLVKDDFVSTISHELRTPLTAICSLSERLLNEPDLSGGQRRELLEIIVSEIQRLTRLVSNVLDFAKIDSDNMQWGRADTDMVAVISEANKAVFQIYQDRNIELSTSLPFGKLMVTIDRDRIIQVIINLLSNAATYGQSSGAKVNVELKHDQQNLTVCVADNGPGIAIEYHDCLFDRFKQLQNKQQGKAKGTGLGLAICKGIIDHHNGKIWVESSPHKGSKFYFTLPLW